MSDREQNHRTRVGRVRAKRLASGRPWRFAGQTMILAGGVAGSGDAAVADALRYEITRIGPADSDLRAEPTAINNHGVVVGYYRNVGFAWRDGVFATLGPDGSGTRVEDINDVGVITGWMSGTLGNVAFTWREGEFSFLPTLRPDLPARAYAINDFNEVVGTARIVSSPYEQASYWSPVGDLSVIGTLGDDCCSWAFGISNAGVVVGTSGTSPFVPEGTPFLWDAAGSQVVVALQNPNDAEGQATGVNITAEVCGFLDDNAVIWPVGGDPVPLPTLTPFDQSVAVAINDRGEAVGQSDFQRPVLWARDGVFELQTLIPDGSGWTLLEVTDINDSGCIVGIGELAGSADRQGFLLTPISYLLEPASPVRAGRPAAFVIEGATPGIMQYLVYSTSGLGQTPIPILEITLDIVLPRLAIAGPATSDGTVRLQVPVPPNASGRRVWFQAAEIGRVSNTLNLQVE